MEKKLQYHQDLRQDQRLTMNLAMEHAFHVLQLPTEELSEWLEREIEQNPVLELEHRLAKEFDPSLITAPSTLYEHLLLEIALHFTTPKEKEIAQFLAGSLDEKGFLTLQNEELKGKEDVLRIFQRMTPKGIGARCVQEALLIQLEDKKDSPLYYLVLHHFHDLLHLRLKKIAKEMHLPLNKIKDLIHNKLRSLNPFPGRDFHQSPSPILIPDVTLQQVEGIWEIEVNDTSLPPIKIHPHYLNFLNENKMHHDEMTFFRQHLAAGKWLMRIVNRRKRILQSISQYLLKKEMAYFEGVNLTPMPLTMKEVANMLSLNESTISRAIANKYLASPRGLIPFRSFFTQGLLTSSEPVSNQKAKQLLLQLIKDEKVPLSDETLSKELLSKGIHCSRRTVTKYRKELKIGSTYQRKLWKL